MFKLATQRLLHGCRTPPPLSGLYYRTAVTVATRMNSSNASSQSLPSQSAAVTANRLTGQRPKVKKAKVKPGPSVPSSSIRLNLQDTTGEGPALPPLGVRASAQSKQARRPDGKAIAISTAESYNTPALLKSLQRLGILKTDEGAEGSAVNLMGEAIYIPEWAPNVSTTSIKPGEVFIFESGTIVTWGLSMKKAETFVRDVIRGGHASSGDKLEWVEEGRYKTAETEVLDYWKGETETGMINDALYLNSTEPAMHDIGSSRNSCNPPSPDLLARLAFSAGMARVTKLGVYEEQFDEFAEGVAGIPKLLESGSESPVKKTDIIKRVGTLHAFRQKLNLEDENLLDEPEFLWENAALHDYYTSVCNALEFETRLETLNQRVDYAFQLQSTLMELLNTKTSHRLEWIIIILIAFEITIVLLREGFAIGTSHHEELKTVGSREGEKVVRETLV